MILRLERLALTVVVVALAFALPARAEPTFADVLAGAKREGAIEVWMATPAADRIHRALFDAFQRRFGVKTRWKWLALHPVRSTARLAAEAAAGRTSADVVGAGSGDNVARLADQGLVRPYPWIEVFGTELPTIREPVARVLPELRGLGMVMFDNVYVVAWNTRFVKADEAPRRIRDFLDPRWRGKFALNVLGGAPFDLLGLELGEAATLDLVRRLMANRPVLKGGTPAVSSAITSGEAHLGLSSFLSVERARRNGEPQAYRFFDDDVLVMPLHVFVPENAPHPNTARLFAAWLVTEGARIVERMDSSSRMSDPDSALATALKAVPPTARFVQERSLADIEFTRALSTRIEAILTGHSP